MACAPYEYELILRVPGNCRVIMRLHFNGVNVMKFLLSGKTDLASIMGD